MLLLAGALSNALFTRRLFVRAVIQVAARIQNATNVTSTLAVALNESDEFVHSRTALSGDEDDGFDETTFDLHDFDVCALNFAASTCVFHNNNYVAALDDLDGAVLFLHMADGSRSACW